MTSAVGRILSMSLPRTLVFGAGCITQCTDDLIKGDRTLYFKGPVPFNSDLDRAGRVFVVTSPPTRKLVEPIESALKQHDRATIVFDSIVNEPTIDTFKQALSAARDSRVDVVCGLGGGSAMDVAKLVAAFLKSDQKVEDCFGIGKVPGRSTRLVCLPTTAGTGSEVSPIAVLLDEREQLKKGVVSPYLMPDASYVDPKLTLGVPPAVTAATGMDALTHCIEAYANKFAHPMIDLYALQGIGLIGQALARAVENGNDLAARTDLALGSMYGGICLGPVNTGAVHALAYPLGGEFHVPHGVSNSVLLPHVLEFNLPAAPKRYADIAVALGAERRPDDSETARRGLDIVRKLSKQVGIPQSLSELNIPQSAIDRMSASAMTVTRLLNLNVREVTLEDAKAIYRSAF